MIYFDNVTKEYRDGTPALSDVTLGISPKEFVSIVGHSGAGKTTLIKMLLAQEKPSQGSVFFEEVDIHTEIGDEDEEEYRYFDWKLGFPDLHAISYYCLNYIIQPSIKHLPITTTAKTITITTATTTTTSSTPLPAGGEAA